MDYRNRFYFVGNKVLESSLSDTFEYLSYLLLHSNTELVKKDRCLRTQNHKMMVVLTASIVEAVLRYIIENKFSEQTKREYCKYSEIKNIYKVSEKERFVSAKEIKMFEDKKMDLNDLIGIANKNKILRPGLIKSIDILRKDRNKIHLSLIEQDYEIKISEVEKHFSTAGEFLLEVEKKLAV